jgi:hypothetical protein
VRLRGAVLRVPAAVAVLAALPQLRIEPLKSLDIEPTDLRGTDRGPDVLLDLADVALPGGRVELDDLQVPVEQLVDGGAGAGLRRSSTWDCVRVRARSASARVPNVSLR